MEWFNYPGLELWKFLNLAIFTAAGIYILRKPISQALMARRDAIKQEIVAAQVEQIRKQEQTVKGELDGQAAAIGNLISSQVLRRPAR